MQPTTIRRILDDVRVKPQGERGPPASTTGPDLAPHQRSREENRGRDRA
jgi:hypothetical protein